MAITVGGLGDITLAAVDGATPTFAQKHGAGATSIDYVIVDLTNGRYESGTGSYNGTTHVLSGRTVVESWALGAFGTAAINATSSARVYNAPTIASVVDTTATQTLTNKTVTAPVLSGTVTGTYTLGGTPTFPASLATLTGTETLTNKTLTTPTIASLANATHTHTTAAGGGALDAAAIATGTIAGARLGSGVVDATTYLRGDGAWRAVTDFAATGHAHNFSDLGGVSMTGATAGQFLKTNGTNIVPFTPTISDFASDGIVGTSTNRFAMYDTGAVAWTGATANAVNAALGDKTALVFPSAITANGDTILCLRSPIAGTIVSATLKTLAGTATFNIKINAISVTGLGAVAVTTTKATTTATGANTLAIGDEINLTISAATGLTGIAGTLNVTKLAP